MKLAKINRHKSKHPRQGTFWCPSCDAKLNHPGSKCKNCGNITIPKRFKKQIPSFDFDLLENGFIFWK